MKHNSKDIYRFLERVESYPHRPSNVRHIQTHISHVYLAPPFVYKIKKPVDFEFLDFSTPEKRKYYCEREVVLNRRLCSGTYLGVVPITKSGEGYRPEGKGEVVEYAVKMKLLDEQYFLHSYIEHDGLTHALLERVADRLADFYRQQEATDEVLQYGKIETVRYNTEENFRQTEAFIGDTIEAVTYEAIRDFTRQYLEEKEQLFQTRIEEQRIVDGHGDLHLEHIHIRPDRICIYDCIEFNDRFRCGDQALDLAFLAMDLDFHDCRTEERYFMELMADELDDPGLLPLIDFYKCYRAYIKGKVKSLQSAEDEVEREDRQKARRLAGRYFNLSLRYALLGSGPTVLIYMGRVGSGKSTLAEYLASRLGIERYSSDRIRKSLAGLPPGQRTPADQRKKLYSASMSDKTYRVLLDEAIQHTRQGKPVILDATYSRRSKRDELVHALESEGTAYLFIEATAPDEILRKRLKSRAQQKGIVSDARLEDFELLSSRYEAPDEIDSDHLIRAHTNRAIPETVHSLYKLLTDRKVAGD